MLWKVFASKVKENKFKLDYFIRTLLMLNHNKGNVLLHKVSPEKKDIWIKIKKPSKQKNYPIL